jgi:dolichol kinase
MDRNDLHLVRKFQHVAIAGGVLGLAGHILLEATRLNVPSVNRWAIRTFGSILRDSEHHRMQTGVAYCSAMLATGLAIPSRPIGVLSLEPVALSTPDRVAACLVGAFAGALAELTSPWWRLDDNFTVPISAATVAWCLAS